MSFDEKSKVISSVEMASVSNVSNLTNDRVEALTGGHGMVNMAIHTVANVITEEILKGGKLTIEFTDTRHLPVEDIMEKAINVAKKSGADAVNAALITAIIMYLAGSAAQVGIPAGNRKLGATARMLAGVDRAGVAAVPTAKSNNKISGFPAVMAIYQAMMDGKLTSFDGRNIPMNVAGGPMYGHSALGEDYIWPEMARNGARIGTQAMMDAMAGAAMSPHPFTAAVLGSAAILEIIHPDAEVPEDVGAYGRVSSAYMVGKEATKTAGLPEKLHFKVTGEEVDTAKLVGDVGLILKDIGAPTVIGMMAFDEMFSAFQEGIAGFSGGPVNAPLGHIGAYAVIGMKALIKNEGDVQKTMDEIVADRKAVSFDPEVAQLSINTICRKANELHRGPVTDMLIDATEPARALAVHRRAEYSYDQLKAGVALADIVKHFDTERIERTEKYAGALFSAMTGEKVTIKVRRLEGGARRSVKVASKYWSFDPLVDITVTMGDKLAEMDGFVHDVVVEASRGNRQDVAWAVPFAAAALCELALNACSSLNMVVPAAVASVMKVDTPKEVASIVEEAAFLSRAIPGGKASCERVGQLALRIASYEE